MLTGYSEVDLVTNRAPVLLHGATEADRRAWAEEAHQHLSAEGPLTVVAGATDVSSAVAQTSGVVFVANICELPAEGQSKLVQCLVREERPKFIIGVPTHPDAAVTAGLLRPDLHYRLKLGRVDLSSGGVKEAIRTRRQRASTGQRQPKRPAAVTRPRAVLKGKPRR